MADHNLSTKKGTVSKSKSEESKPTDEIKHMCKQILGSHRRAKDCDQNIWTKHLGDGMKTLGMTLDLCYYNNNDKK